MHQSCQWSALSPERRAQSLDHSCRPRVPGITAIDRPDRRRPGGNIALSGARLLLERAPPKPVLETMTIGRPSGWGRQGMETAKCIAVRNDQIQAKAPEHGGTIIATAKFTGGDVQESAHMSTEALWGAVVEVIRDVRNGEARIFKEPSSPDEPCHCEIALGRRHPSPKEAAHQRTGGDIEKFG